MGALGLSVSGVLGWAVIVDLNLMGCQISKESEGALAETNTTTASQFRKCFHVILYFPATLMIENYNKKAFVSSVQCKIQLI